MKFLISQVIQRDLADPRLGLITVLRVEPTEDLKEAKIYVSVFGSRGDKSKAERALNDANPSRYPLDRLQATPLGEIRYRRDHGQYIDKDYWFYRDNY